MPEQLRVGEWARVLPSVPFFAGLRVQIVEVRERGGYWAAVTRGEWPAGVAMRAVVDDQKDMRGLLLLMADQCRPAAPPGYDYGKKPTRKALKARTQARSRGRRHDV